MMRRIFCSNESRRPSVCTITAFAGSWNDSVVIVLYAFRTIQPEGTLLCPHLIGRPRNDQNLSGT